MSNAAPEKVSPAPKPKSSSSAVLWIVVVILALMCIPALLGGLAVAGVFVYWRSSLEAATSIERMESMPTAIEADRQDASQPPDYSLPTELEPAQP